MKYQTTLRRIHNLPWENLDTPKLEDLMVISGITAREYTNSLRIARTLLPEHKGLRLLTREEWRTSSFHFGSYSRKGDRADFLRHFVNKSGLLKTVPHLVGSACVTYDFKTGALPDDVRLMSVVSRERDLTRMMTRLLSSPPECWQGEALQAFRYYLARRIRLRETGEGHLDPTSSIRVTNSVLKFYKLRLELYQSLFADHNTHSP